MDDAMQALAQRAVKCKAWRWLPGMQAVKDASILCASADASEVYRCVVGAEGGDDAIWCSHEGDTSIGGEELGAYWLDGCAAPDLTDRATVLLLLDLVRDAWGDPWAQNEPAGFGEPASEHPSVGFGVTPPGLWRVIAWPPAIRRTLGEGKTEAEALVAALEAAR